MLGTSCSLDGGGGKASEAGNSVRPLSVRGLLLRFLVLVLFVRFSYIMLELLFNTDFHWFFSCIFCSIAVRVFTLSSVCFSRLHGF